MRAFSMSPSVVLTNTVRSPLETYTGVIKKASDIFDRELMRLMESVHYNSAIDGDHRLPHLAARLDFSGFYAGGYGREEAL